MYRTLCLLTYGKYVNIIEGFRISYKKDLIPQEFYSSYIFQWKIQKPKREMNFFPSVFQRNLATEVHKNPQQKCASL